MGGAEAGGGAGGTGIVTAVADNGQAIRPRKIKTRRRIIYPLLC
jgi:hypothetical protein